MECFVCNTFMGTIFVVKSRHLVSLMVHMDKCLAILSSRRIINQDSHPNEGLINPNDVVGHLIMLVMILGGTLARKHTIAKPRQTAYWTGTKKAKHTFYPNTNIVYSSFINDFSCP